LSTEIDSYLDGVVASLGTVLGQNLAAVFVTGSLCLGDFEGERSDIDILCVCGKTLSETDKINIVAALSNDVLPCPAAALDLSVFGEREVRHPTASPSYELGLTTGPKWGVQADYGGSEQELALDLAICRRHGQSLQGPEPAKLIGPIPESWILDSLRTVVDWHRSHIHHPLHDPLGHFAILNACRALRYFEESIFSSKLEAGRWMSSHARSQPVVERALAIQARESNQILPEREVLDFLAQVSTVLGGRR
jgi:streptomycin 3"-adenylyltransferase